MEEAERWEMDNKLVCRQHTYPVSYAGGYAYRYWVQREKKKYLIIYFPQHTHVV